MKSKAASAKAFLASKRFIIDYFSDTVFSKTRHIDKSLENVYNHDVLKNLEVEVWNLKSCPKIKPRVGWRLVHDEIAAFNCENQLIAIWNETASALWELISKGMDFDGLIDWMRKEYRLERQKAEEDILAFLYEAASMGFIDFGCEMIKSKSLNQDDVNAENGENVLLALEMKAIEYLVPFAVTFETTYNCNERCLHCYMERNLPHLSFREISRVLDEIAEEGCLFVSFTGGEFFARNDALAIVDCASKLHFVIDILSNGTLVTRNIAETLACRSVRRVQISIYGAYPETHDFVTRLPGSFFQTIRGIEYLIEAGVKVELAFPLMKLNFHERYAVKELASSLGCLISPSPVITARNNGLEDTFSLRLDDNQLKEFLEDKDFADLYAGRKPFQDHQFYFGFSDLLEAAPCYSGFNSCAITPSGKVLPCNQLLLKVGDLKENSFAEIWRHSPELKYLRGLTLRNLHKCANCKIIRFCARCPGLALLEGNNLLGPSPENCRISSVNRKIKKKGGRAK